MQSVDKNNAEIEGETVVLDKKLEPAVKNWALYKVAAKWQWEGL